MPATSRAAGVEYEAGTLIEVNTCATRTSFFTHRHHLHTLLIAYPLHIHISYDQLRLPSNFFTLQLVRSWSRHILPTSQPSHANPSLNFSTQLCGCSDNRNTSHRHGGTEYDPPDPFRIHARQYRNAAHRCNSSRLRKLLIGCAHEGRTKPHAEEGCAT